MKRWIDCHCHLSLQGVSLEQVLSLLSECHDLGLQRFVLGGYDPLEWRQQRQLAKQIHAKFYFSAGIHPWVVTKSSPKELDAMFSKLEQHLPSAHFLGELGLDSVSAKSEEERKIQMEIFQRQLHLAEEVKKPLMLHMVGWHREGLANLQNHRGYVHAFSGDWTIAKKYLDLGFKLSFDPRSISKSREVIEKISDGSFLIESDAPNKITKSPAAIFEVANEIANIRGKTRDEILDQGAQNFEELLVEI